MKLMPLNWPRSRLSADRDAIAGERTAFQAVQLGEGGAQVDARLQLADPGEFQGILGLEDQAAGGEAGVETGFFQLVLALAQLGGHGGNLHALEVGLDRTHGGADLDHEALLKLLQAGLLAHEVVLGDAVLAFRNACPTAR
jgi:hypothetical protein